jgi:hypothetical protein
MTTVLQSLSQHSAEILLVLCALVLVCFIAMLTLAKKVKRMRGQWSSLLDGAKGENIERLLYDHLRERMALQEQFNGLARQVTVLEESDLGAKRYVGLVRYDAFEDVGGGQSFALAIYDERGDGAILTSVVGRSDCRVYCKPLLSGRSERNLSQEEQRAIQEAKNPGPKTIVSH